MIGAIAFFFIGLFIGIMPVALVALFVVSFSTTLTAFVVIVGELWFGIGIAVSYYRETQSGSME